LNEKIFLFDLLILTFPRGGGSRTGIQRVDSLFFTKILEKKSDGFCMMALVEVVRVGDCWGVGSRIQSKWKDVISFWTNWCLVCGLLFYKILIVILFVFAEFFSSSLSAFMGVFCRFNMFQCDKLTMLSLNI
jgi:hypothetical protein